MERSRLILLYNFSYLTELKHWIGYQDSDLQDSFALLFTSVYKSACK